MDAQRRLREWTLCCCRLPVMLSHTACWAVQSVRPLCEDFRGAGIPPWNGQQDPELSPAAACAAPGAPGARCPDPAGWKASACSARQHCCKGERHWGPLQSLYQGWGVLRALRFLRDGMRTVELAVLPAGRYVSGRGSPAPACCAVWGLQLAVQSQREDRLPAAR